MDLTIIPPQHIQTRAQHMQQEEDRIMQYARLLLHRTDAFAKAHQTAAHLYRRYSYAITIPTILVNSTMALVYQQEPNTSTSYLVSTIFILNTVLSSLREVFKFERRAQFHIQQADSFDTLAQALQTTGLHTPHEQQLHTFTKHYRLLQQHKEFPLPPHLQPEIEPIPLWQESYVSSTGEDTDLPPPAVGPLDSLTDPFPDPTAHITTGRITDPTERMDPIHPTPLQIVIQ